MDVTASGSPDLTPRPAPSTAAKRRHRIGAPLLLALVLIALGVVLFEGLSNATVFFCNANEVGVRSECGVGKRFRLQGTVDDSSVQTSGVGPAQDMTFTVTYLGRTIPVTYHGEPGGIFKAGLPVVVEGRMGTDGTFAGDRILVKHTEQYRQQHPDRVPADAP